MIDMLDWNKFSAMTKLRELRELKGLSQSALAERANTSQPQIKRLESGERKLTKEWAERLAPHLGASPEGLMFDTVETGGLPVMGKIEAGQYRDISLNDEDHDRPTISVARDDRFPHARQYALEVCGDSMDELFPDGSFVICANFADLGIALRPGLIVHVERMVSGTHLVENTLKEIAQNGKGFLLKPRSRNKRHEALKVEGDGNTEIVVKGIVTGKWEPMSF